MTIRHQLDTLSITDAPGFPLIDDAIITCELSEFSPTSEDELSGLMKKIAAKSCSLDPVPASLLGYCINDLLPIIKRVVNLSFNLASMPSSMKNASCISGTACLIICEISLFVRRQTEKPFKFALWCR